MDPERTEPLEAPLADWLLALHEVLAGTTLEAAGEAGCLRLLEEVRPRCPASPAVAQRPGTPARLGRFEVLGELGSGGSGVVFLAFDPQLGRRVALKVPRPEAVFTPQLRQRFLREARAAAGLDHPNLVPLYEAGELGPLCYLASAWCAGPNLAAWLREQTGSVPFRSAAALTATLAGAVQHIHDRGIWHRDLKPSNILLEPVQGTPGEPSAFAVLLGGRLFLPRITDFGLAKLFEAPGEETRSGAILGTPAYMAPEQAEGRLSDVGPGTDVYALGVVLYELLTGRPPFQGGADLDTLRQIAAGEPAAPHRLRPGLPRDLQAICLKCLEKDPARRYARAQDLADDLRRFLEGRPTLARPLPAWRRGVRWARRRPLMATLSGVAVVVLLGFLAGAGWHYRQLRQVNEELAASAQREHEHAEEVERQRGRAEERTRLARRQGYVTGIRMADTLRQEGQLGLAGEMLGQLRAGAGEEELRGWEWRHLWQACGTLRHLRGHRDWVCGVAFLGDGRTCASVSADRTVRIWDVRTGAVRASWPILPTPHPRLVAFSPGGHRLLSAGSPSPGHFKVAVWDTATGKQFAGPVWATASFVVALSPDGRTAVVAMDSAGPNPTEVRCWDAASGRVRVLWRHGCRFVTGLSFTPDGRSLVAAVAEQFPGFRTQRYLVELRDLATGKVQRTLGERPSPFSRLAVSADGRTLAAGGDDGIVKLWDVHSGKERAALPRFDPSIEVLAFAADGKTLAVGTGQLKGETGTVSLWDVASGARRAGPWRPGSAIHALDFHPDGETLIVGCDDDLVRLWRPLPRPHSISLGGHRPKEAWAVAFAPDGKTLASAGDDHRVRLWDVASGRQTAVLAGHDSLVSCVAFAPDGRTLATGCYRHTVQLWDVATGKARACLRGHRRPLRSVAFSPDGKILASAAKEETVKLWEAATGREIAKLREHAGAVNTVVFAADGRTLASASEDGTVRLWDMRTRTARSTLRHPAPVWSLALTGAVLASGCKDGTVRLWQPDAATPRVVLRGHQGGVRCLAFAPDGRTLASGAEDRTVRLWHAATGHELLRFKGLEAKVNSVAFSPDGRWLAAALHDGTVRLWAASTAGDHR